MSKVFYMIAPSIRAKCTQFIITFVCAKLHDVGLIGVKLMEPIYMRSHACKKNENCMS